MSKKRKRRFEESPAWVIASIAGGLSWGVVTAILFFVGEVALAPALLWGAGVCAVIAVPVLLSEAALAMIAIMLEFVTGAVVFVLALPLLLLSGC